MPFLADELNAQADDVVGRAATVHLHDGDPGATGLSNELSGGSYAAVAPSFNAGGAEGPDGASSQPATDGVAWAKPSFTVPAATITYWSMQDSGGDCLGYWPVDPAAAVEAGTYSPSVAVGPGV